MTYSGKTKEVGRHGELLLLRFTDRVLGRNGMPDAGGNCVVGSEPGRGARCRAMARWTFAVLAAAGLPTHFRGELPAGLLVEPCARIPLEVIVRNAARGSFIARYGSHIAPGTPLPGLVELTLKDDAADDPLLTPEAAIALGLATAAELADIDRLARAANAALRAAFAAYKMIPDDFKLEFGRSAAGSLMIIDELGINSMRLSRNGALLSAAELADWLATVTPSHTKPTA
ncbi:MAG TPA: phosphoribosylaminoimidazolesuccinocarboxamide synthase [bacterium]|nr:phosphoribosylaminoimidazolesuccinocarboxamide synthase [bacterium]